MDTNKLLIFLEMYLVILPDTESKLNQIKYIHLLEIFALHIFGKHCWTLLFTEKKI